MKKIQPIVDNTQLKKWCNSYITKKVEKRLQSNKKDWNHIALVLLSDRKIALSEDKKLIDDIINFPKFKGIAADCPSKIKYL